jgi:hypothetical protein
MKAKSQITRFLYVGNADNQANDKQRLKEQGR